MKLLGKIRSESLCLSNDMTRIRRDLHMMPEPALEEYDTSAYIIKELEKMGLEIKKLAGTGVLATLYGNEGEKTIAIRADIDALPIQEKNDIEYSSKRPGFMHACGHDGHAAMALGAAGILNDLKPYLKGNVKFIFQPAEEQYGGAERMIAGGALRDPDVDAIIALHLWPDFEKGKICFKDGCIMASNDKVEISVKGRGGHGAMPHLCVDALTVGCSVVNNIQTFVSREINPLDNVVITLGTFNSGSAYNVVSDITKITGTVRAVNESTRSFIEKRLKEIVDCTCRTYGAEYDFNYVKQYPPTINNHDLNEFFMDTASDIDGKDNVVVFDRPYMTAEDFSYYLKNVPGCLCFLGTRDEKYNHPLHNERFNFDEDVMAKGAAFMAACAVSFLNNPSEVDKNYEFAG